MPARTAAATAAKKAAATKARVTRKTAETQAAEKRVTEAIRQAKAPAAHRGAWTENKTGNWTIVCQCGWKVGPDAKGAARKAFVAHKTAPEPSRRSSRKAAA